MLQQDINIEIYPKLQHDHNCKDAITLNKEISPSGLEQNWEIYAVISLALHKETYHKSMPSISYQMIIQNRTYLVIFLKSLIIPVLIDNFQLTTQDVLALLLLFQHV